MPSKIELPYGLGARYKDDPKDYPFHKAPLVAAGIPDRPARVDNRHLFENIPVWNQGKQGACTGMAIAAGMSVLFGEELSPKDAFEKAKLEDEWPGEDYDGSSTRAACKGANKFGTCLHSLYPFIPFVDTGKHPTADANALEHMLARYERLWTVQEMLAAIADPDIGFFVATVMVHTGWIQPTSRHRIRYDPRYVQRGAHAIVACGYDEIAGYWLIRNSWKHTWGDGGYAWLKFDDWLANGYDAWAMFAEVC